MVIEDTSYRTATGVAEAFQDATKLLLERINHHLGRTDDRGIIITDKPGGGSRNEERFLDQCLETLLSGTDYVNFLNIVHNVLTTHSHFSRLLQVADVITSCCAARVAGESIFAPQVFEIIKPHFDSHMGRIGGFGLNIHPDSRYANLYHWLLGDNSMMRSGEYLNLPIYSLPYYSNPNTP